MSGVSGLSPAIQTPPPQYGPVGGVVGVGGWVALEEGGAEVVETDDDEELEDEEEEEKEDEGEEVEVDETDEVGCTDG